jgi:hypothetical protein
MNPIDKFRYLDKRDRHRLFAAAGILVAAVLVTSTVVITRCSRTIDVATGRMDTSEQDALTQVREAFFAVSTALAGDPPAPTVGDAVQRVASEKGAAALKTTVGGEPLKFNPKKTDWSRGGPRPGSPGGGGGGGGGDGETATVLVVAPAPAAFRARNVAFIGVARGGLPVEITAGSEPSWLASAVTAPN